MPGLNQSRQQFETVIKAASAGNWNGCAITQKGVLSTSQGLDAVGIVQDPDGHAIGDFLTVAYMGELKYRNAGTAALSGTAFLTTNTSGRFTVAGCHTYVVGTNLAKTGDPTGLALNVGSDLYGIGLFCFPSRWFVPNSAGAINFYAP